MFGIPIDKPDNLFCDNEVVYGNSTLSESHLRREQQYIGLYWVCECVKVGILIPHRGNTSYNLAYLLTKSLSAENHIALRSHIMYIDNPNT